MINEGFRALVQAGVLRRKVVDDQALMQRVVDGDARAMLDARLDRDGEFLHGAFYLGSPDFYDWLRTLDDATRRGIGMRRVSAVNELYGGNETLERLQRRDARFFNTCMMATALGAAVSDGLEDGRVVSGVGGQYNFVAMAHALPDARSVAAARDARRAEGGACPTSAGTTATPPSRATCATCTSPSTASPTCAASATRTASWRWPRSPRTVPASVLLDEAKANGKLRRDFSACPTAWQRNTPARGSRETLAPFRARRHPARLSAGQRLHRRSSSAWCKALGWLKARTATRLMACCATIALGAVRTARARWRGAWQRMRLHAPTGVSERLQARLLRAGTATHGLTPAATFAG
jgi:hypothetical protein